jgi:hypothetical protein
MLEALLTAIPAGAPLSLDRIGEEIGDKHVTPEEIYWLVDSLEHAGRAVGSAEGGDAMAALRQVLPAARALRAAAGRSPRVDEIVERTGLPRGDVLRALLLAQVMGR